MNIYHNLLPIGETLIDPPAPPEHPGRDALLDLYDCLNYAARHADRGTPRQVALTEASAAVRQRLAQLDIFP